MISERKKQLSLLITAAMTIASSFYFLWFGFDHIVAIMLQSANNVCGCIDAFSWNRSPLLNGAMVFLSFISLIIVVKTLFRIGAQLILLHQYKSGFSIEKKERIFHKKKSYRIALVKKNAPLLCTIGIFRPTIFMSTYTNALFSAKEKQAALLHEIGHIRHHDTRVRFFLWHMIPKKYHPILELQQEHRADQFALSFIDAHSVLSALTRMYTQKSSLQSAAFFGSTEERMRVLLEKNTPSHKKIKNTATLFLFLLSCGFFLFAHSIHWSAAASSAHTEPSQCLQQQKIAKKIISETPAPLLCVAVTQTESLQTIDIKLLTEKK